jgi:hypothetical protein
VRLEGLGELKKKSTSGLELATFQFVVTTLPRAPCQIDVFLNSCFRIIKGRYSQDSSVGIATGYRLDGRRSILAGVRECSVLHSVQIGFVAHPISYPMSTGAHSSGVTWWGSEADHSPPASAEVSNGGAIPPLSTSSSFRGV